MGKINKKQQYMDNLPVNTLKRRKNGKKFKKKLDFSKKILYNSWVGQRHTMIPEVANRGFGNFGGDCPVLKSGRKGHVPI